MMPDDGLDALRDKDAILFGSAGDPHIPDHITLWGLRLKICQGFDQYANVRPTRILPGIDGPLKRCGPDDLNWVIVRENSEGEYSGVGGRVHQGHPIEAATDVSMMTRAGVERIMRFAFKLAQSRPRKLLTVITKSNAQRHAMVMWDEIALQISKEFPDVTWDKELVDASTARMINRPASLDTIVATNLHADILSDLAAALAGSLGIAPTGNIDPERRYPSMFEPIHGSAFDIMGKGLANPVGTFWSVVMLLEHLGETEAAAARHAGDRGGHRRPGAAHPRPGRQGDDGRGDAGRVRSCSPRSAQQAMARLTRQGAAARPAISHQGNPAASAPCRPLPHHCAPKESTMRRNTCNAKIVATLGPASDDRATIEAWFDAGADVFRLNFSHGTHDDHKQRLDLIRPIETDIGRPIGVLLDLQGPKLRVGTFAERAGEARGGRAVPPRSRRANAR